MSDVLQSPEVIKNYDLLERIGIFDYIKKQNLQISSQETLLNEIIEIYDKQSNIELTDFVISRLMSTFVPSLLMFIFQPHKNNESLEVITYEKMKAVEKDVPIANLDAFQKFFTEYPNTISFPLFEYEFPDKEVLEYLKSLNPDIIVPLLGRKGLYGVIIIGKKIVGEDYTNEEIVYIDRLMRFTSIWLQNNVHYTSSVMDSKTKVYNHSYLMDRLTDAITKYKRYETSCSLLMCDVDHFKRFNDQYGHLAGDEVLCSLARTLEESVREVDVVARYGGEEFAVLLSGNDTGSALSVAERIRQSVENMNVRFQGQDLKVTISIGLAHLGPGISFPEDLIARADSALYQSKANGRNQTTLYRPGLLAKVLMKQSTDAVPKC